MKAGHRRLRQRSYGRDQTLKGASQLAATVEQKYLYADLTWPEVNEAVAAGKVILLPVGTIEQHGPHLPLDVDLLEASSVCLEAGRRAPGRILVAPSIPYGFNVHAMDFPGTLHVGYEHLIGYCVSVCKSFAYHGFKRIVLVNGHGSNGPCLDLVSRRVNLETDAVAALLSWWDLLSLDPGFVASFRESVYPGGCGHACEVETSVYLHLAGDKVQMDKAVDNIPWTCERSARTYEWTDLFGAPPVNITQRHSNYTATGACGQPTVANAEKGRRIFEEAVAQLVKFVDYFQRRSAPPATDHHAQPPTSELPTV
jgi:creatinine amidohydrolase